MQKQHIVPVHVKEHLDALPPESHAMLVNLYHTESYLVINAGLPRCLPGITFTFLWLLPGC